MSKGVVSVRAGGKERSIDVYFPLRREGAPLAIVVHGFSRNSGSMAGWGAEIARIGAVAVVPTLPAWADMRENVGFTEDLIRLAKEGALGGGIAPARKVTLVGFSMGGLVTLVAASREPVDAWMGLDPLVWKKPPKAAARVACPSAVLRAPPSAWNRDGRNRLLDSALPCLRFSAEIAGATHIDPEWPTDLLGSIACGGTDVRRQELFRKYGIAFLGEALGLDPSASATLGEAAADPGLRCGGGLGD